MTADSTELTFVRCPSCRSLVPAKSTRCRMCGAALEALAKGPDSMGSTAKKSRIRQKTTTVSGSSAMDDFMSEGTTETNSSDFMAITQEQDQQPPIDDPLSAYIEEVDVFDQKSEATVSTSSNFQEPAPTQEAKNFEPPVSEEFDDFEDIDSNDSDWEDEPTEIVEKALPAEIAKQAVTNGNGHSVVKPIIDTTMAKSIRTETAPANPVAVPHKVTEDVKHTEHKTTALEQSEHVRPVVSKTTANKKPVFNEPGKLVGWLVSYQKNKLGESRELREGKCFVTGSSLKPNDLVIDDASVSTPHAIMAVSSNKIALQDLMSDHGVSLKQVGSNEFQHQEDHFTVNNGDYVRFGNVEFLVVMLPNK